MFPVAHLRFCASALLRFCAERGRLLDLLTNASDWYAKLANRLCLETSTMNQDGHSLLVGEVEKARMDAEHAREALFAHKAEHGC